MLIYGFWVFAFVLAIFVIGGALYWGLRGRLSLIEWRITKLVSALLGAVGIVMLLFNFEKTARDILLERGKQYAYFEFVDAKFFIAQNLLLACSKDQTIKQNELTCFDYKNIDGQVSSHLLRNSMPFNKIVNWQHNPDIDAFIVDLNGRLENINRGLPEPGEDRDIVTSEARIELVMLAVLLVTAAIAGSVGEAAFQVRLVLDEQRLKAQRSAQGEV